MLAGVRKNFAVHVCLTRLLRVMRSFPSAWEGSGWELIPPRDWAEFACRDCWTLPDQLSANSGSSRTDGIELEYPLITWCDKTLTIHCSFPPFCSPSCLCTRLTFCLFLTVTNLFSDTLLKKNINNAVLLNSQLEEANPSQTGAFRRSSLRINFSR